MRQAQTLNEAQLRRVIQYCRSRRHPTRDQTIILFSFYAGLRAKEIAALKHGDVFDEQGGARTQFTLSATQSKGGKTRTVYVNQRLRRALAEYAAGLNLSDELCGKLGDGVGEGGVSWRVSKPARTSKRNDTP